MAVKRSEWVAWRSSLMAWSFWPLLAMRLELQRELWVQLAARENVALVAGLPGGRRGTRLGAQRLAGMVGLL